VLDDVQSSAARHETREYLGACLAAVESNERAGEQECAAGDCEWAERVDHPHVRGSHVRTMEVL
jgi:hypothetical protein